jgi:hypothetical protein
MPRQQVAIFALAHYKTTKISMPARICAIAQVVMHPSY